MKLAISALAVVSLSCFPALAKEGKTYIDPDGNCAALLSTEDSLQEALIATWALGYLSAKSKTFEITSDNIRAVQDVLAKRCDARPDATLADLLSGKKKPVATDTTPKPTGPGSEADARAFLAQFVQSGADRDALTKSIVPTEAEIRMVYKGELADALVGHYEALYGPGVRIGPKTGQTEILTWHTQTDDLINRSAVLREFPGGYKRVLAYMNPGFPIVRFKFVKPGETLGMSFNGLIYTGDRWVLMPKPWHALK